MDIGFKYFRILTVAILLGWLIFLAISIYYLWINSSFLEFSGDSGESLRKLSLALAWGAALTPAELDRSLHHFSS